MQSRPASPFASRPIVPGDLFLAAKWLALHLVALHWLTRMQAPALHSVLLWRQLHNCTWSACCTVLQLHWVLGSADCTFGGKFTQDWDLWALGQLAQQGVPVTLHFSCILETPTKSHSCTSPPLNPSCARAALCIRWTVRLPKTSFSISYFASQLG